MSLNHNTLGNQDFEEKAFERSPAAMVVVDRSSRILDVNRAFIRGTHLSRNKVLNVPFSDIFIKTDSPPYRVDSENVARKQVQWFTDRANPAHLWWGYDYFLDKTGVKTYVLHATPYTRQNPWLLLKRYSVQSMALIQKRKFVYFDRKFVRIGGYSRKELLKFDVVDAVKLIVHPNDQPELLDRLAQLDNGSHPKPLNRVIRIATKQGKTRWVQVIAHEIVYGQQPTIQVLLIDVTKQKKVESALRASENTYHAIFEASASGMMIVDHDRKVERVNHAFAHALHAAPSEIQGKTVVALNKAGIIPAEISDLPRSRKTLELDAVRFTSRTGHTVWLQMTCLRVRQAISQTKSWLVMAKDVTDSMKAEQLAAELPSRIIQAHDEEKQLISQEIHDTFTQSLAALKMRIQALEARARQHMTNHTYLEPMNTIVSQVDELINISRNLARTLRPDIIDTVGLVAALTNLAEETESRFGIKINTRVNCKEIDIGNNDALQIFRIVQEALTNSIKHSHATQVDFTISKLPHKLSFSVKDNGRGFDLRTIGNSVQKSRRLGLKIMQERAKRINASLVIQSKVNRGSSVTIDYPIMINAVKVTPN